MFAAQHHPALAAQCCNEPHNHTAIDESGCWPMCVVQGVQGGQSQHQTVTFGGLLRGQDILLFLRPLYFLVYSPQIEYSPQLLNCSTESLAMSMMIT